MIRIPTLILKTIRNFMYQHSPKTTRPIHPHIPKRSLHSCLRPSYRPDYFRTVLTSSALSSSSLFSLPLLSILSPPPLVILTPSKSSPPLSTLLAISSTSPPLLLPSTPPSAPKQPSPSKRTSSLPPPIHLLATNSTSVPIAIMTIATALTTTAI